MNAALYAVYAGPMTVVSLLNAADRRATAWIKDPKELAGKTIAFKDVNSNSGFKANRDAAGTN